MMFDIFAAMFSCGKPHLLVKDNVQSSAHSPIALCARCFFLFIQILATYLWQFTLGRKTLAVFIVALCDLLYPVCSTSGKLGHRYQRVQRSVTATNIKISHQLGSFWQGIYAREFMLHFPSILSLRLLIVVNYLKWNWTLDSWLTELWLTEIFFTVLWLTERLLAFLHFFSYYPLFCSQFCNSYTDK